MRTDAPLPRVTATEAAPASSQGPELVGDSATFNYMRFRLEQVARTHATVLLLGETGTGKGMAARLVHALSPRSQARLVCVDCTSLPSTLIESELFGREKGAFTDAGSTQVGRFELANGGTIFLDEIGELSPEAQAKLLRVIQYGEFERLGSPRTLRTDVRVIAATNRNLAEEVKSGQFRSDLYYRLSVFPITMPPLRDRRGDVPALVDFLVEKFTQKHGKRIDVIPNEVLERLASYDWPGNIRELENVIERAIITAPDATLRLLEPLGETFEAAPVPAAANLFDMERAHIMKVLKANGWRIEGRHGAAETLGLKPSTLRSRMRKLGVRRTSADLMSGGNFTAA